MWIVHVKGNTLEEVMDSLILGVDSIDEIFVTSTHDDLFKANLFGKST